MRIVVGIFGPDGLPAGVKLSRIGDALTFSIESPYLVSAGQPIDIGISVFDADQMVMNQVGPIDATHLTSEDGETPLILVPIVWDVSFIPSRRLLADIFADVVKHDEDYPSHGFDCSCMDQYAREIRLQVSKALPPDGRTTDTDWAAPIQQRLNAKARIRHVLNMVVKGF